MKLNELEALVKEQGEMIKTLLAAGEEMQGVINGLAGRVHQHEEHRASILPVIKAIDDQVTMFAHLMGYDTTDPEGPFFSELTNLIAHVDELDVLVKGRNKSAAVKRNMTDADALSVLTGDHKDEPHKIAAEKIGLTYAQVYSCRMEYTFKHVHHELRKNPEWKSPWKK